MRDDVNYRQRAEETKLALMNSLTISDFAKHRSEYNWLNTQKQALNKGELHKDRKQFLDTFLPRWEYDTDVLLEKMHGLKVKELYNQGYSDLKLFSDVSDINDAYILAYNKILDVKTLMNIPTNLLLVKNINDEFLFNLQRKLKEGVFKPTKRAFNLAQAISRVQYGVLREYEGSLYFHHLSKFWLFNKVEYTYNLSPKQIGLFNLCSPSYYDEKTGVIKMVYNPKQINGVVIPKIDSGEILGCNTMLMNLPKTWNNPAKLNELLNHKEYNSFFAHWMQCKKSYENKNKSKDKNWNSNGFIASPAAEFSSPGDEINGSGGDFGGSVDL